MIKYKLSVLIFISLFILSCADEEIPWELKNVPEMLVVEGELTSQMKEQRIKLSKTADYFSNTKTPDVTGAKVSITDGEQIIPLFETLPGEYVTKGPLAGMPGRTYSLEINLPEPLMGMNIYSASSEMKPGLIIDSINAMIYENPFYIENEEGFSDSLLLVIVVFGFEPEDIENIYQLNLYKNGELLNDTIDETILIRDTEEFEGSYVNTFLLLEQFQGGDTVDVEIKSVDEGYLEFVRGVGNLANQSSDPFDMSGPPANAIGNIENGKAIGYFLATQVSRAQTYAVDFREIEGVISDNEVKTMIKDVMR